MSKLKWILLCSLIVTLPINIIGFVWLKKTWSTYHLMDPFVITMNKQNRLFRVGSAEFDDLIKRVTSTLNLNEKPEVQLLIKDSSLNSLFSDLPLTGTDSQKNTYLMIDDKVLKGKTRLRGDHVYHWGFADKSWRFRTSKGHVYDSINKFNFIIPKSSHLLINHISYTLAKHMGLLAPESRLVDFFINGIHRGPRLMVEQIDESFLRKNRRMPNDVYKGDDIGQRKHFGVDVSLFNNASIWDKASYNNHYDAKSRLPLTQVLSDLAETKFDFVDIKTFATFAAFIDLASSYHHDQTHNWILYYDHYYEKMFPIVWDTTGWNQNAGDKEDLNIVSSDLLRVLYKNYDFIKMKYAVLNEYFKNKNQDFLDHLSNQKNLAEKLIKSDANPVSINPLKTKMALNNLQQFQKKVIEKNNSVKEHFLGDADKEDYKYSTISNGIRLQLDGSKLVNAVSLKLNKEPSSLTSTHLSYVSGDQNKIIDMSKKLTVTDKWLVLPVELLANAGLEKTSLGHKTSFKPATYDLVFEGLDTAQIESVQLSFLNLRDQIMEIQQVPSLEMLAFDSRYVNIINIPEYSQQTWSGEKHFSGFTVIEDDVVIEPGTQLIFAEGATLKLLGKVTAIGTAENPIVFDAADSSKPWGALALKDERANDSVFKHVIFKNGSGDKGDLYEYTAMFSVHNVHGLLVEDSEFYDTKITDDMVHIIYSDVHFKNSTFVRSLSDAVDIDISTAIMENCRFVDSGNDSVDLMTSDAIVINSVFENSGDKGISIGENSRLLAINNHIEGAEIGMQSKDTSKAYIYNTSFVNSNKAVDAYHKNWRYSDGGTIYVDKCVMLGNKDNATVGKKSLVVINDCEIDSADNFNAEDVRKGKIILSNEDLIPPDLGLPFFDNHNHLIQPQTKGFYD